MKKKLLTLLLLLTLSLAFSACSDSKDDDNSKRTEREEREEEDEDDEDKDQDKDDAKDKEDKDEPTVTEEPVVTEEPTATEEPAATEEPVATEAPVATEEPNVSVSAPSELSGNLYDFQISMDGMVYQFPMWFKDFEALGWNYTEDASYLLMPNKYSLEYWKKDGFKTSTKLINLTINGATMNNCLVAGINISDYYFDECDWEILLPGGIQYGVSTKDDVIAAYGEPSDIYEGTNYTKLTYEYDTYQEIELKIDAETGVLNEIDIENMIALEGGDNNVYPDVPELLTKYTAPAELGTDLYSFNMELEGALYTLPCPVTTLLANGFTYNEKDTDDYVAAGSHGWIELQYNNQNYRCIVRNYADYATVVENCFVTSMKSGIYDPDFALTIPCGITRGMAEADVLTAIEGFNYEKDVEGDFTYYEIYHPDGSKLDSYEVTIYEGVVAIIEVQNSEEPVYE